MPIRKTITKGRVPVKIYTDDVDPQAINQLLNVAQLPFVHSHVAAMPDVHVGIGATVGAVIPTKGAIIPAAVGVDIGCFVGDTKIPLLDGTERTLRELAERGGEHWVYTIDRHHQITGAKATARLTRCHAPLLRIVLDNDAEILCTPDHRFMLRDGSWREARELQPKTSLMPFYSRIDKDGYTLVRQPATGTEQRFHWTLARSGALGTIPAFPGQRTVLHHLDFNRANNHPDNLKFMGDADHSAYHRLLVERNPHWQSPAFEEKRKSSLSAKAKTPEGHAYFAKRGTPNLIRYMTERPDHFKSAVAGNGQRGRKFLLAYNQSQKGRAKSAEISQRLLDIQRVCPDCGQPFKGHLRLNIHKRWEHGYNHKVKQVEMLEQRADVYCLTVPGHENFALSAGVFVHNCGMNAVRLSLKASQLPDNLRPVRAAIEAAVPVGFAMHADKPGVPASAIRALDGGLDRIVGKHPGILKMQKHVERIWAQQLGTLGGGNHFIELCLDENQDVWVMLHSGSRGIGNIIGRYFIDLARKDMGKHLINLPDRDLAYLQEGAEHFDDYVEAVRWAQDYAMTNRREMMRLILAALARQLPPFTLTQEAINCHHNYVAVEHHFGENLFITRKGAIRAGVGDLGIIPGSMGARSYIVRGKGEPESFCSCAHGAGRRMSRGQAKKKFDPQDLIAQTAGVECRKDAGVIDEIPGAYKPIDEVMAHQTDLVEVVHTLKQVVCVKG
ncbi:MAG: RtcB family protein [Candidatus Competibacteraceae bacterium]